LLYAAVGRHPLVGLAAAFAAVSGGYAGNITPGQIDVLLFGFTEEAAQIIDPTWTMNPLGNWWFILAIVVLFTPIIWFVTDRIIEPRLGKWGGSEDDAIKAELAKSAVTKQEKAGLFWAGLVALLIVGLFAALLFWPGYTPFIDETREGPAALEPFYRALITGFFLLFLFCGIAFGIAVGTVKNAKDVIDKMIDGIRTMAPYIVFALFAAHFVAMFNWSRLGPIAAINGAEILQALALPAPLLLVSVLLFSSFLDLFIGSASAKWSALSPVVVPMFMLLGISPEMTQAAYRMGDSYTNIMTPLMSYFPLILAFARRWDPSFGVGSLLSLMLPYALCFMVAGILMTIGWVYFDIPLGPHATVSYTPPGTLTQ
jgi:aminobenzoyl-glutamate transport protein